MQIHASPRYATAPANPKMLAFPPSVVSSGRCFPGGLRRGMAVGGYALVLLLIVLIGEAQAVGPRKMENLGRGVVAVRKNATDVFVSWRLLGLDPQDIRFNVYRSENGGSPVKLNREPLGGGTNLTDTSANLSQANVYSVRPVIAGVEEAPGTSFTLSANAEIGPLFRVALRPPHDRRVFHVWVGDLDGDGEYEFIVSLIGKEPGQSQKLQAYKRDGVFLWEVDFGPGSVDSDNIYVTAATIAAGQWDGVTVYDLDSDGKSEVIVKSANGVTFGDGKVLKYGNDLTQFLSVLDGQTGAERTRAELPNPWKTRIDRPLGALFGIGYFDGENPSLVIHAKNRNPSKSFNVINSAWDYRDGELKQRWSIQWDGDNDDAPPEGHQIRVVDVDGDGRDELFPGMHAIGSDGKLLYSLGDQGVIHGDRFHISDLDPERPGLEGYGIQQNNTSGLVEYFYEAKTGKILWTENIGSTVDAGRGIAADVDPRYPGLECWSFYGMHSAAGEMILKNDPVRPWPNLQIWWDGDELGENLNEEIVEKWDYTAQQTGRLLTAYRFGANANARNVPAFYADLIGDWREEIVYGNGEGSELVVFTTTDPTDIRLYTLAHNPAYRNCMTVKGYYQENLPDYFLGHGMKQPPVPNIVYARAEPKKGAPMVAVATSTDRVKALQDRVRAMVERQRAEEARNQLPSLQGQPRALLIVKTPGGKVQLAKASAVTSNESLVVAELSGGGKAVWQKQMIEQQLPWPLVRDVESRAVDGTDLMGNYRAAAELYPELRVNIDAESAAYVQAIAKVDEQKRKAQMESRLGVLMSQQYAVSEDYGLADLESMVAEAQVLRREFPEKAFEIDKQAGPFLAHLEYRKAGKKFVNGAWLSPEDIAADAMVRRLEEQKLPGIVLSEQEVLDAVKLPLSVVAGLALSGLVFVFPRKTRWLGVLLFGGAIAAVGGGYFLVSKGTPPNATTGDGMRPVQALILGSRLNRGSAGLSLDEGDLNAFLRQLIAIDNTPSPSDALCRTSISIELKNGKILLSEHVRRGAWRGVINYVLLADVTDGSLSLESVCLGNLPIRGGTRDLLWHRLSTALRAVLSPDGEGLRIRSVGEKTMELARASSATNP